MQKNGGVLPDEIRSPLKNNKIIKSPSPSKKTKSPSKSKRN